MVLPGVAGAIISLLIWVTPESPRFVMDKKGYEQGVLVLARVRKGDAEAEARAMQAHSEAEAAVGQIGYRELLSNPSRRRRVFVACYLQIAQQLTGVNAFLSFQTQIFEGAGVPREQINAMPGYAIYFNLLMLVGCVLGLCLIDSSYGGRRSQLLGATWIMGPPLLIAGICTLAGGPGWIPVIGLFLYGPGFQLAWGMIPWVYPAEIFAMNERDKAVSLSAFCNFAINFLIVMITPSMLEFSSGWTFVFYGLLNISNLVFVFVCIKETKGIAVEDAAALFDKNRSGDVPEARQVQLQ